MSTKIAVDFQYSTMRTISKYVVNFEFQKGYILQNLFWIILYNILMIQMLHYHDQKGNKDHFLASNGICRDGSFL